MRFGRQAPERRGRPTAHRGPVDGWDPGVLRSVFRLHLQLEPGARSELVREENAERGHVELLPPQLLGPEHTRLTCWSVEFKLRAFARAGSDNTQLHYVAPRTPRI